jgi:hypothetical protein
MSGSDSGPTAVRTDSPVANRGSMSATTKVLRASVGEGKRDKIELAA